MNLLSKLSILLLFFLPLPLQAGSTTVPHEIAGIKLGETIDEYPDIEYSNFLKEVVVMDWHGFRKGIISYGICQSPGTILKIRMKYENATKSFFNTLLKKYKKKFGPPMEWKGDSFGIKHIWKWKFIDSEGIMVNLILQHNLEDPDDNLGNMIKLSYPELVELERLCFNKKCEEVGSEELKKHKETLKITNWNYLIPN